MLTSRLPLRSPPSVTENAVGIAMGPPPGGATWKAAVESPSTITTSNRWSAGTSSAASTSTRR
jgi:hypothetical protein